MARRAIHFHDFMKKLAREHKDNLKGQEVVPLNAGIHFEGDKANKPNEPLATSPKQKKAQVAKGTPEAISNTQGTITITTGTEETPMKSPGAGTNPLGSPALFNNIGLPIGPSQSMLINPQVVTSMMFGAAAMMPALRNLSPMAY
jgi:hypothetical protein